MKWGSYLRKGMLSRPPVHAPIFTSLQVEETLFRLGRLQNLDWAVLMEVWSHWGAKEEHTAVDFCFCLFLCWRWHVVCLDANLDLSPKLICLVWSGSPEIFIDLWGSKTTWELTLICSNFLCFMFFENFSRLKSTIAWGQNLELLASLPQYPPVVPLNLPSEMWIVL